MSIPKITGREARELLDIWSGDVEGLTFAQLGADRSYGDLFGAAPALAETVAWLYGREPDHVGNDRSTARRGPMVVEVDGARQIHLWPINGTPFDLHITADDAVDLARALLAAAEEARP